MPDNDESRDGLSESPSGDSPIVEQATEAPAVPTGNKCAACEEGTCEEHKTVTKKELAEELDRRDEALRTRVAKTAKKFRKALKARDGVSTPVPSEPPRKEVHRHAVKNPVLGLFQSVLPRKKK